MSTISKEWTSRPIQLAEHNVCLIFVKVKYFPLMWLIMWNIPLIYKLTSLYHCGCIYILYKIHEQCSVCKSIKMKTENGVSGHTLTFSLWCSDCTLSLNTRGSWCELSPEAMSPVVMVVCSTSRDTAGQERFRTITTAYYRGAMVRDHHHHHPNSRPPRRRNITALVCFPFTATDNSPTP